MTPRRAARADLTFAKSVVYSRWERRGIPGAAVPSRTDGLFLAPFAGCVVRRSMGAMPGEGNPVRPRVPEDAPGTGAVACARGAARAARAAEEG